MRRGDSQCPLLVKARVHRGKKGGVHFWVFLILTFCNFNWLEKEAIYNPAIYSWLHWYSWPGRWHLKRRTSDDCKASRWLYSNLLCCMTGLQIVSSESLTTACTAQMVPRLLHCPTFTEFLHLQGHYRFPTLSHLSYYAIIPAPSAAVLFSTFCHNIIGSELPPLRWCLSAWCLRAPLGKWEGRASICVHVVRGKTTPKHVSEQEAS